MRFQYCVQTVTVAQSGLREISIKTDSLQCPRLDENPIWFSAGGGGSPAFIGSTVVFQKRKCHYTSHNGLHQPAWCWLAFKQTA